MADESPVSHVFGLFPTAVRRTEHLLDAQLLDGLIQHLTSGARQPNAQSDLLTHTRPIAPKDHKLLQQVSRLVMPHIVDFGALLFGERLNWSIKEMWVNVLETGGQQSIHNHANSFVSGILYLTESDRSANTVFVKALGGRDFILSNAHARTQLGAYNADKWVSPDPAPGDMLLFPSYLLHQVPENKGGRRISLAFNAIPDRLDSWGYTLRLAR